MKLSSDTSNARIKWQIVILLMILLTLSSARPRPADARPAALPLVEAQRVERVGRLGGLVSAAIPLPDGTALMAEGPELVRIAFSGETASILARRDLDHGIILDMLSRGPLIYALTEEGLSVLHLQEALIPSERMFLPGSAQTLASSDTLLAAAANDAGLRLYPLDELGIPQDPTDLALDAAVIDVALSPDGRLAYAAAGSVGVIAVDISDPTAPQAIGTLPGSAPTSAIESVGALIAVAAESRILLLDPNRRGDPVGVFAPLQSAQRIIARGDYLYAADGVAGLKIFRLVETGRLLQVFGEIDHPAVDLWLNGNLLYLIGPNGIRVFDISSPSRPLLLASLDLPGQPQGISVTPDRIYAALGDQGVGVIDAQNLAAMELVRRIPLDAPSRDVLRVDNLLYVATDSAGLGIIDLSAPAGEQFLSSFPLPAAPRHLARQGDGLFVAAGEEGLLTLDISQPSTPTLISIRAASEGQSFESVSVAGRQAYVSAGDSLLVLDIRSPYQIGQLAHLDIPAEHAILHNSTLIAASKGTITTFDAAVSARPLLLKQTVALNSINHITAYNDLLLLSGGDPLSPLLTVISVEAPDAPTEQDSTALTGSAYRAAPSGSDLLLARGYSGLARYRLTTGGSLALTGLYGLPADTAHIARGEARLVVGGRSGWAALALSPDAPPALTSIGAETPVRALAAGGNSIVAASEGNGLLLYQATDDRASTLTASRTLQGPAGAVAIDDSLVYAADPAGLSIHDRQYLTPITRISTPSTPVHITLTDGLAYLPLSSGEIAIAQIGDPHSGIEVIHQLETPRPLTLIPGAPDNAPIALADDQVYQLGVDALNRVYIRGRGPLGAPADGGFVANQNIWTTAPDDNIRRYGIPNLNADPPRLRGVLPQQSEQITITDGYLYIADADAGLLRAPIFNLRALSTIVETPMYTVHPAAGLLFAGGERLTTWDPTASAETPPLAALDLPARPLTISGGRDEFLLLGTVGGLVVAEWDGTQLALTGQLATRSPVEHALALGTHAYLALDDGGLLVADLSDPAAPQALFTHTSPLGEHVMGLHAIDDQTLLVSWSGGLELLNVANVSGQTAVVNTVASGGEQALDFVLSPGGDRSAVSLGNGQVRLFDLSDPRAPLAEGTIQTTGNALAAALNADTLFIADGRCGLRIFDVSDPADPRERGYWRSSYASDVTLGPNGQILLAEANQLITLRYDPAADPLPPPAPQIPTPASGTDGLSLDVDLAWGPEPHPCEPLHYNVYLGISADNLLLHSSVSTPALTLTELDPRRTYYWQVEAIDRQGDTLRGPVWRFTTATADYPDNLPPAPPIFLERLRENPLFPILLTIAAALVIFLSFLYRRSAPPREDSASNVPDWFISDDE